jgi:O-antigen/teichoic acid export membrane protein
MSKSTGRLRLLLENFFAYGVINVLNRIIPLLLLPVLTRLLTDTADFGRFDMFNTLVSFGSALAGLGMYDAMFREYFERDDADYKKRVTSNTLYIVLVSSFVVAGLLLLFQRPIARIFLGDVQYKAIIIYSSIGVVLAAWQSIIAAPTRIQNKRTIYIVSGTLSSVLYYGFAIFLIIRGFTYFGLIAANLLSGALLLLFFYVLNRKHFAFGLSDRSIRKELYKVGIPLMPTFLIYWVFHSVDKIMITNMMGLDQVGIYSIGSRVASISQLIYAAFAGGWQYFAFSTMHEEDQVQFNSKIFEYLAIISMMALLASTFFDDFVFNLLFTGDYAQGVIVFPYLFIAPLTLMLFQVASNQFLVVKRSGIITASLVVGALANVVLNYFLIKSFGIKGCALATLIGYILSLTIMMMATKRENLMGYGYKLLLSMAITIVFVFMEFIFSDIRSQIFAIIGLVAMVGLYGRSFISGLRAVKRKH